MGEFSDIAYNHLACVHGVLFEGRGFGVQTGANGTTDANRRYAAVCAMVGVGDTIPTKIHLGLAALIDQWRAKGAASDVKPHAFFTGSRCPGTDLRRWIAERGFELRPVSPENPHNFWTWLRWYEGRDEFEPFGRRNPLVRPNVPARVPAVWWARRSLWLARRR